MRLKEYVKHSLSNRTTDTLTSTVEEIVNASTHAVGLIIGILGIFILIPQAIHQGTIKEVVGTSIFAFTLVFMYLTSTLYHSFFFTSYRKLLRIIDHSAIFIFIAGTYTPFTLVALRGNLEWVLLGFVWLFAACGIYFNLHHVEKRKINVVLYLLMGWISILIVKPLIMHLQPQGILLLSIGGAAYTVGVVFYIWKKLIFNHLIWHIAVLIGSLCHFAALYYLIYR